MPAFLEAKLKKEYGANSKVPYMVMNKLGAMHGNKETAKGAEMERKHDAKVGDALSGRKRNDTRRNPRASAVRKAY